MEQRLVATESNALKRYGAFFSEMLNVKEDLNRRLQMIEGQDKINKIIKDSSELFEDILDTVPAAQKRNLRNTFTDYKIALVPLLQPDSTNIIMQRDIAKELVDVAMAKCVGCVEDDKSCKKCRLYKLLEVLTTPSHYETLLCPFSLAEWGE